MKNNYLYILFAFTFTFFGVQNSFAQESKEILELKSKLSNEKRTKEKSLFKLQLSNLYANSAKYDSAIIYIKSLITDYEYAEKYDDVGVLTTYVGKLYAVKGDLINAEKYGLEGKKMVKNIKNDNTKAILNDNLAAIYSFKKENKKAIELYNENIRAYLEGKNINKHYVMQAYGGLFTSAALVKDYGQALKFGNSYLDFIKKNFPNQTNTAYYQLGNIHYTTKNYKKAIELYKKAVSIESGNKAIEQLVKLSLAQTYLDVNKIDSAKIYIREPLEAFEKSKDNFMLSMAYYVQGKIYKEEGELAKAEEILKKAISLSPEQDLGSSRLSYNIDLSKVQLFMIEKGIKNFSPTKETGLKNIITKNESFLKEIENGNVFSDDQLRIEVYENLVKANELSENYNQAFSYLKKMGSLKESIYGADKLNEVSDAQSEIEITNARAKLKLEEETKRIQLQKELELKALRYEFDKKQAAAKTEEERQRLLLEEEHKRREISIKYNEEQKAVAIKYEQEKKVAKAEQQKKDAEAKAELSKSKNIRNMSIGGALAALLLLGFAGWSYNQKRKDGIKIAAEKKKSEDLLLNILPQEVAQELKEKGKSDAKYYDEVSVLFTDFVNFTATSEKIGVQELLEELNVCFTEFDNIMGKHGLEKIKTIGDAYLAVSGLPTINKDHAKNAIAASQDILKFIEERKKVSPNALDLRIGIHSGQVIAGIVGVKKFAYDIWGDTVNTAARMEQSGEKGKINISKNTYELVKDDFATTYRGKISVKGKGEMEMYFVEKI